MGNFLTKNFLTHNRGADGNLIPIEYTIPEFNKLVSIIPTTRGEMLDLSVNIKKANLLTLKETKEENVSEDHAQMVWETFIIEHIENPKLDSETFKDTKLLRTKNKLGEVIHKKITDVLLDAIYEASGIELEAEEELKKN